MTVRFHDWFFNELRALMGDERGVNGEPSAHDFLISDLPLALARLEEDFERWATASDPPGTWTIVLPGKMVKVFALKFHLVDEVIEVYDVVIETWFPQD